jgi:C4-dicarboxylate-specific signal transduction histidine kinase
MAGAIAHELNQPLAALTNYARACQLMLVRGGAPAAAQAPEFNGTLQKLLEESRRASEVVRRLRNLFSRGDTHLERVDIESLLSTMRTIGAELGAEWTSKAGQGGGAVEFSVGHCADPLVLLVDRLQIDMTLRNLLANAFESVRSRPAQQRRVAVTVSGGEDHVAIRVADSGPGVPPSQRERMFEAFHTSKATGMGIGLAVSRAIAEAHGGTLAAAPGAGDFTMILTLPCRKVALDDSTNVT